MTGYGLSAEVVARIIDRDLIIDREVAGVVDISGKISTRAVFSTITEELLGRTDGNGIEIKIITDSIERWKKDVEGEMMRMILWVLLSPAEAGKVLSTEAGLAVAVEGKRISDWLRKFIKESYSEEEAARLLSEIEEGKGTIIIPATPADDNKLREFEAQQRVYKVQA